MGNKSDLYCKDCNKLLYYYGVTITFFAFVCFMLIKKYMPVVLHLPCIFNIVTGYYCPGCGGTRSIKALLHGHIIKSIKYNFFATYIFVLYLVFMVSHTISVFTKGKVKGFDLKPIYIYAALVLLALNFIIRNSLLFLFGIEII